MKKVLTILFIFTASALMLFGCEKKSDDKKKDDEKTLLLGLALLSNALPPTQSTGSAQDVSDASSAAFASAAAMSQVKMASNPGTGMMQSIFVDPANPHVKDDLKKSILDAVNANAIEKMKYVNTSCSGTNQINIDLTSADAITGTNYTITPEVHVSGSYTCNSAATAGSYSVTIILTGKVTATFDNMTVQVFDIENYKNTIPHEITFKEVSVNGTVTISEVNVTTSVSFNYSVLPIPGLALVVKNVSGATMASNLQMGTSPAVKLDLSAVEKFDFSMSLLNMTGSISAIVKGTVDGREVSLSYGFSGENIYKFGSYLTDQIGYKR